MFKDFRRLFPRSSAQKLRDSLIDPVFPSSQAVTGAAFSDCESIHCNKCEDELTVGEQVPRSGLGLELASLNSLSRIPLDILFSHYMTNSNTTGVIIRSLALKKLDTSGLGCMCIEDATTGDFICILGFRPVLKNDYDSLLDNCNDVLPYRSLHSKT